VEEKLTQLFFERLVKSKNIDVRLKCCFITGSYAYPEFLHSNSDLDVTYIVENVFPKSLEIVEKDVIIIEVNEIETRVEYSIYSFEKYADMLRNHDLVLPYALIRGYKKVMDEDDNHIDYFYSLAKDRFNTTFDAFLKDQPPFVHIEDEIKKNNLYTLEIIASFNIGRIRDNMVISHVKFGFLLRVIIVNFYRLKLMYDHAQENEIRFIHKVHFIMINNEKSFRIFDVEKYDIESQTRLLINWINEYFNSLGNEQSVIDYTILIQMWKAVSKKFYSTLLENRLINKVLDDQ
jgi:hypothetical protein